MKRSYAAHLNGVENIAPWAAVVFSLLYTGNNTLAFSALCLLFVCSRVLFVVFYIANLDVLRTIVFHGGLQIIVMGFCMAIFKPSVLATFLTK